MPSVYAADAGPKRPNEGPEIDEIISGPFSEYGEFDSSEDEAADEKFFQFGRFFGIGLSGGATTPTDNAGELYQGGFPTVGLRIDYWFDFQFALQINVENSKHNYDIKPDGLTDVNFFRLMLQVKYYFDTRDLSAPITFIGPHLLAGGGMYTRTDTTGATSTDATIATASQDQQAVGFNFGAGFELTLKPKKTYLQIETLIHIVQFPDSFDTRFASAGIPDKSGNWLTFGIALLWTW